MGRGALLSVGCCSAHDSGRLGEDDGRGMSSTRCAGNLSSRCCGTEWCVNSYIQLLMVLAVVVVIPHIDLEKRMLQTLSNLYSLSCWRCQSPCFIQPRTWDCIFWRCGPPWAFWTCILSERKPGEPTNHGGKTIKRFIRKPCSPQ